MLNHDHWITEWSFYVCILFFQLDYLIHYFIFICLNNCLHLRHVFIYVLSVPFILFFSFHFDSSDFTEYLSILLSLFLHPLFQRVYSYTILPQLLSSILCSHWDHSMRYFCIVSFMKNNYSSFLSSSLRKRFHLVWTFKLVLLIYFLLFELNCNSRSYITLFKTYSIVI